MDEYIEREALRKVMQMATDDPTCPMHIAATVDQYITEAPVADVVPVRHGMWIYDHWCEFKCSVCGEFSNSKPYRGKENYCPNCGAIMDGKCKESEAE